MKRLSLSDQVFDALKTRIDAKIYPPKSALPSIADLAREFSVASSTIREALIQLENLGLVEVRQGKGIMVREPKIDFSTGVKSFSETILALGMQPGAIVHLKKVEPADSAIASKLGIQPGDLVNHIVRLRLADGLPMAVETSYSSMELFCNLTEIENLEGSLYSIFTNVYQRKIVYAIRTVEAVLTKPEEQKLLGLDKRHPALKIETVALDRDKRPLEYGKSVYRADRYQFVVHQTV